MLLRIILSLAIVLGIGAASLGYYEASTQIPALAKQRDDENALKKDTQQKLTTSEKNLKRTKEDLAQTTQQLSDTKKERDTAVARGDAQEKRAQDLTDKLTKTTSERDDAQNELATYKASGLTADQVVKLNKTLKDDQARMEVSNAEKVILNRTLIATQARLEKYEGTGDHFVKLRADLKGKIVEVDPKWNFVVLNIGNDEGAFLDGELLVSRDGKLVAKVIISRVEKNRCVANIVSGWKLGDPIEGDIVTPAHPTSS